MKALNKTAAFLALCLVTSALREPGGSAAAGRRSTGDSVQECALGHTWIAAPAEFKLSTLSSESGLSINGNSATDYAGWAVSAGGDVNGDNIDDMAIGAYGAMSNGKTSAGAVYIVFGTAQGSQFDASLEASSLDGTNGFVIEGKASTDYSGRSVSMGSDLNGDGVGDIVIGAYGADPGASGAGEVYVIFGKPQGQSFDAVLSAADLDGSNGFTIEGAAAQDQLGGAVSVGGDVNSDGVADLAIGASKADSDGKSSSGAVYVVFGKPQGQSFGASLSVSALDGSNGFVVTGAASSDQVGASVSVGGDLNSDGVADLAIGAIYADPDGLTSAGEVYVVFGKPQGQSFASALSVSALDGSNGFVLRGGSAGDLAGTSVSLGGDLNNDGVADLAVGAAFADPNGVSNAGVVYVVWGKAQGQTWDAALSLGALDSSAGLTLQGKAENDHLGRAVSAGGDLNGDTVADLSMGAEGANQAGEVYVLFGGRSFGAHLSVGSLTGVNGTTIRGIEALDNTGASVSMSGDVNGDGVSDVLIGAYSADINGFDSGRALVYFGVRTGCVQCGAGTFKNYTGPGACHRCPTEANSAPGATSIAACICRVGHTRSGGTGCSACPAGTFKPITGPTSCTVCSSFKPDNTEYVGLAGFSSECDYACAPGFKESGGKCVPCEAGTFKPEAGNQQACSECKSLKPDNTEYSGEGGTSEDCSYVCAPGYKAASSGCVACEAATYKDTAGQWVDCKACSNKPSNAAYSSATGLTTAACPYICDGGGTHDCPDQAADATVVTLSVMIGMSEQEFTADKQQDFRRAVAIVADVTISQIRLASIGSLSRRRLLQSTTRVDVEIYTDEYNSQFMVGKLEEQAISNQLNLAGLPGVVFLEAPEVVARAPEVLEGEPKEQQETLYFGFPLWMVAAAGGGVLVLIFCCSVTLYCFFCRGSKLEPIRAIKIGLHKDEEGQGQAWTSSNWEKRKLNSPRAFKAGDQDTGDGGFTVNVVGGRNRSVAPGAGSPRLHIKKQLQASVIENDLKEENLDQIQNATGDVKPLYNPAMAYVNKKNPSRRVSTFTDQPGDALPGFARRRSSNPEVHSQAELGASRTGSSARRFSADGQVFGASSRRMLVNSQVFSVSNRRMSVEEEVPRQPSGDGGASQTAQGNGQSNPMLKTGSKWAAVQKFKGTLKRQGAVENLMSTDATRGMSNASLNQGMEAGAGSPGPLGYRARRPSIEGPAPAQGRRQSLEGASGQPGTFRSQRRQSIENSQAETNGRHSISEGLFDQAASRRSTVRGRISMLESASSRSFETQAPGDAPDYKPKNQRISARPRTPGLAMQMERNPDKVEAAPGRRWNKLRNTVQSGLAVNVVQHRRSQPEAPSAPPPDVEMGAGLAVSVQRRRMSVAD